MVEILGVFHYFQSGQWVYEQLEEIQITIRCHNNSVQYYMILKNTVTNVGPELEIVPTHQPRFDEENGLG